MNMDFKHLMVSFYADKIENKRKSAEEGRPIFDDLVKVKIQIAGDPKSVFVGLAHDQSSVRDPQTNQRLTYAQLHSGPYEAFKRNESYSDGGTPLSEATFLTDGKRAELKGVSIYSIEQLAGLDGTNLQRLGMGGRELKGKAQAFLDAASGTADVLKLAGENQELKDRLAALETQMLGSTSQENAPVVDETNPFHDWDKETIAAWFGEQGGNFNASWGIKRAREEANILNNKLAEAA